MSTEDNVIDAEIVDESDNLPAVVNRLETTQQESKRLHKQRWKDSPKEQSDWRTEQLDANQQRRCAAHLSDGSGERCRKWAITGGTTCATHGSGTKAAKAKARERLDSAADRMVSHLLSLARFAESEAIQLKATDSAIDRTLGRATQQVVLSQGDRAYEEVFDSLATTTRAESREARGVAGEPSQATDYDDLQPEYVARDDVSPSYQHRADPAAKAATSLADQLDTQSGRDAPPPAPRPRGFDRQRGNQPPHITGDDALRVAADLAREQLALTSPHKRYRRP